MRRHADLAPKQIVQLPNAQMCHGSRLSQGQRSAEVFVQQLFRGEDSAVQLQLTSMALLKQLNQQKQHLMLGKIRLSPMLELCVKELDVMEQCRIEVYETR
ncbi:hypothetical protein MAALD49_40470 (plasmid) [Marinobacter shengliensis]|nr:hypothetical protein MAALD49_40470 [Marinobacter shengliensis]